MLERGGTNFWNMLWGMVDKIKDRVLMEMINI